MPRSPDRVDREARAKGVGPPSGGRSDRHRRVVWGLFVLLERIAEQDKDLADPEVDTFFEVAEAEIGTTGLLSGWAIVAAFLRKRLIVDAAS